MPMRNIGIIDIESPLYPRELRSYKGGFPPSKLYVMPPADLGSHTYVGVVGTRKCSDWGRRTAYEVGKMVARLGLWLATGFAECVDASASLGALDAGGYVVGVRPWLKPFTIPQETKRIWWEHRDRVILVSENYRRPHIHHARLYYYRNRLISGMSSLVVVVEAKPGGGTMHMEEWALRHGKPLALFEHPDKESVYHRGFMEFVKAAERQEGAELHIVRTVEELEELVRRILRAELHPEPL